MPWFDFYVLHVKLMLIPGRIGRYIQITWDPFVHLETSCGGEGVKKFEIFIDIIDGSPLTIWSPLPPRKKCRETWHPCVYLSRHHYLHHLCWKPQRLLRTFGVRMYPPRVQLKPRDNDRQHKCQLNFPLNVNDDDPCIIYGWVHEYFIYDDWRS